ncbi:oligosaccharide flippase family protein [Clostridium baratii]|uniref:oligosaccharide flippase family protein n=1 Tax=Clostridium baratii TaxID=1561 RepID=UPI001CB04836|nr:oligosaccharide flippase family protein [Clostridium baratii]STA98786.1 polysaccharide biosynthesis protein [Clostridium baratii]
MKKIYLNVYAKNTILNYIYRISSMVITYLTVPITLSYLNNERYGIWQTMLTIISWASLSNFGIGNGLRNKVTESFSEKKYKKLKGYITSAYIYLSIIAIILLISFILFILAINVDIIFKNNNVPILEIKLSFMIIIVSFCLNFILGICNSISFGIHKSSAVSLFQMITNIIILVGLYIINEFTTKSIINIALLYFIANTVSNIIFSIYLFSNKYLRPNLKYKNKIYGKELRSLGMEFFVLQLASIVLFSTDNFIISTFIGASEVADYSIANKLFQVISTLYSILLIQLWSSIAEINLKKDYKSIKKSIKGLAILLIPVALAILFIIFKFNFIMRIWIGKELNISKLLICLCGVYAWLICFNGIFVNVQNGMGKIRVQTISSVLSCILNIPLAIFFIKILDFGVIGVMISNIICLSVSSIMCASDVFFRLLRKNN